MSCWIPLRAQGDSSTGGTNGPQGYRFRAQRRILRIYPELKDHLQEQQTTAEAKPTQEKLDRLICGLRQTKYARELIRTLGGELGVREAVSARYS